MKIDTLIVGPFEENCYLIHGTENRALIVDPGYDAGRILNELRRKNLTADAYLLTHGHADHLAALHDVCTAQPAPVYLHSADGAWAFGHANQIPPYYPVPQKPAVQFIHPGAGAKFSGAGHEFTVFETPGHTPGCICFYFEKEHIICTGDTLFKGSCGRTDLPGGDSRALTQSLKTLAALPPETAVYPGHGDSTTIGYEKRTNFFMQPHT
ncbi:MAG: MBL fold metallo-hydrolase [Kiritimatiellales bacterium]